MTALISVADSDRPLAARLTDAGDAQAAPNPPVPIGCLTLFELGPNEWLLPRCGETPNPMVAALLGDQAMVMEQHGVRVSLRPGDWTLYSPSRTARLLAPGRGRVILFPRESFGEAA